MSSSEKKRLTAQEKRERQARKRAEADRALFIASVGLVGWQRELERRRGGRNERTRQRTREAVEAKRVGQQNSLFEVAP